jgi:hypothetical protein
MYCIYRSHDIEILRHSESLFSPHRQPVFIQYIVAFQALPSKQKYPSLLHIITKLPNYNKLFYLNRQRKDIYHQLKMKFSIVLTLLPVALAAPAITPITGWNPFISSYNWGCWSDYVSCLSFAISQFFLEEMNMEEMLMLQL